MNRSLLAAPIVWMLSTLVAAPMSAQSSAGATVWRANSLKPTDSWNTLVAEISVRRRQLSADGSTVGVPPPAATYRLERSMASGSWKTVLTVLAMERAPLYSLDGLIGSPAPLTVSRIEDDEDGTPVRAFDSLGRSLRLPEISAAALAASATGGTVAVQGTYHAASTAWIDSFVASPAKAAARQLALEREFGKPIPLKGLTRFVKTVGTATEEVLVMATSVVPVEANGSESKTLMSHRTFAYQPASDGAVVRSTVHSEQRVSLTNSDRYVTDTAFSNVALERR